jgi:Tfp pilus assembly protein PilF
MASENDGVPPRAEVEKQLERMLAGKRLKASPNRRMLLEYVVKKYLENETISEDIIGYTLFPGYEADESDIVRVTANQLRKTLSLYYAAEGLDEFVRIELPPGPKYKPVFTYNPRLPAHQEYSRGLYMLSRNRLGHAQRHFTKAVQLQPRYLEAYLGQVTASLLSPLFPIGSGRTGFEAGPPARDDPDFSAWFPAIRTAVARALAIDRKSWRAHVIRGVMHAYQHHWEKAARAFDTALRISPDKTRDDPWYVAHLVTRGKLDEASAIVSAKVKDSPNDVVLLTQHGLLLYTTRNLHLAHAVFLGASSLDENYWPVVAGQMLVGLELCLQEKETYVADLAFDEAQLRNEGDNPFPGLAILCLARCGKVDQARRDLEFFQRGDMEALQQALAYLGLGEMDEAVKWLNEAFEENNPLVLWLHMCPILDPLRNHEGFKAITRRMSLVSEASYS